MSTQGPCLRANARMYAVSEAARNAWQSIFEWMSDRSGVPLTLIDYPPPSPLGDLWRRPNLGGVFMCGWPFTRARPQPRLLAAPVPLPERYGDKAVYYSDLVVHRDSSFQTLEDTFQGTVGWTLTDSNSGFNLLRHHLLQYRSAERPQLYSRSVGQLVNPLGALQAVAERVVDVAPVDSFCHDLFKACRHPYTSCTRTIATTAPSPIPALIASADVPGTIAERLSAALVTAHHDPQIVPSLRAALIKRFDRPEAESYLYTESLAHAAETAGYPVPT
jgi:ABC-type phosphate/phosphonate transport system substrate-binding protein